MIELWTKGKPEEREYVALTLGDGFVELFVADGWERVVIDLRHNDVVALRNALDRYLYG